MIARLITGLVLGLIGSIGLAHAHGDEEAPPTTVSVAPRVETRLGDQEMVLTYTGGRLVAFLQRYVDGAPTAGAAIELTMDFLPTDLKEIAPGVYGSDPVQLGGGSNDIDIALTVGQQKQTATVTLVVGSAATATTAALTPVVGSVPGFVLVIGAVVVFLAVNALLIRRGRPRPA